MKVLVCTKENIKKAIISLEHTQNIYYFFLGIDVLNFLKGFNTTLNNLINT